MAPAQNLVKLLQLPGQTVEEPVHSQSWFLPKLGGFIVGTGLGEGMEVEGSVDNLEDREKGVVSVVGDLGQEEQDRRYHPL